MGADLDDEADLDQALEDGELTRDQHDGLLDRLWNPVDLNAADRDTLYGLPGVTWAIADAIVATRAAAGRFEGVEDLASVPGLPRDEYQRILPYVTILPAIDPRTWSAEASVAATWRTAVEHPDHRLPGLSLSARTAFLKHGSAGFLVTARPRLGMVHDAAPGQSLSAAGTAFRLDPGAFWIAWDGPSWSVIGGSFRLGFGLGLTIGDGRHAQPRAWSAAGEADWDLRNGGVAPRKAFHGFALRVRGIGLPLGSLDLAVFASARLRDLPADEVTYDRCPPGDPGCPDSRKVPLLVDACATLDPATGEVRHLGLACEQPTLPFVLWDVLGGANLTWRRDDRTSVGVTGYAEWLRFVPRAAGLRLAPSSPYPEDRMLFGAADLDVRFGRGILDLAGEATVTDRGHPAVLLTGRLTPVTGLEIRPSARYFSPGFDNPWAHTEADAEEVLGNRARDELGGRVEVEWRPHPMVRTRMDVDVTHHQRLVTVCPPAAADSDAAASCVSSPLTGPFRRATDLQSLVTLQILPTRHERLSVTATCNDRDLARSGRRLSYAPYRNVDGDFSGGMKVTWTLSGVTTRLPRTSIAFQVRQAFEDVATLSSRFDQTWSAWLRVATNLSPGPAVSLRVNFQDESTVDDPRRVPGQVCDFEERGPDLPARLPASCRGGTRIDAILLASQAFAFSPGRQVIARLRAMWSRWLDHRGLWRYGSPCDPTPSRDSVAVQGSLTVRF